ncbi:MBL fold metallo-hydrolase [Actinomycetes bacterium M1A6_2h]
MSTLSYDVLVLDGTPRVTDLRMPNGDPIISSPLSITLVYGDTDAVLVDAPFTFDQVERVGNWIEKHGKRLKFIYATHGHGDHWFGTSALIERFPGSRAYATEGTIALMHQQATTGREQLWDKVFPGIVPASPIVAEPVPAEGLELEGHELRPIEVGHTDTDDTTVLHVPSIGLVVAGDVVYNGVHQMLLEIGEHGLDTWLKALDTVDALRPSAVVAGHKDATRDDDPANIDATRRYLLDAKRLLGEKPTPREYFDAMIGLHPTRLNQGPVWYGALGLLGQD